MRNKKSTKSPARKPRIASIDAHSEYLQRKMKDGIASDPSRTQLVKLTPITEGLGDRSMPTTLGWRPFSERAHADGDPVILSTASNKKLTKKLDKETDILNSYWGYKGLLEPEYDLLEPYTLIDTEAYFKQATERKIGLSFRNSPQFVGENQQFVKYIETRVGQLGLMMDMTFETFLKEVLKNLLICSNCIVVKIRDKECSGGTPNPKNRNKTPVAAYKIVPPQTIFPLMDGQGHLEKWRRLYKDGRPWRDYDPEDVIHFYWDRKPGHMFGTPRYWAVRDDIYALRRLEENSEMLFISHLFPIFHVQVGSEEQPCQYYPDGSSEIDVVKSEIQNMPKEGILVTDVRTNLTVKGAEGKSLDPKVLLDHYKQRVFTGLGVSPLDMGETDTGGKGTADNVSQNLKDAIKADLSWFADQVKMFILKELFQENRTQLSVQNALRDVSLAFHEVDTDSQIKMETHATNLYNNGGLTNPEYRKSLKQKPLTPDQEKDTMHERTTVKMAKLQHRQQKELVAINHANSLEAAEKQGKGATRKTTTSKSKSATGTVTHKKTVEEPVKGPAKTAKSRTQPENQYGKNLDPHKARSSQDPELAKAVYDEILENGAKASFDHVIPKKDARLGEIKKAMQLAQDNPDLLWVLIKSAVEESYPSAA